MALPQLCIQIVQNFETIDLAKLHLHLEELLVLRQLLNQLLSLLQLLVPLHLLVNRVGSDEKHLCAGIDYEAYGVIQLAYYLSDFQMHPAFDFLSAGPIH